MSLVCLFSRMSGIWLWFLSIKYWATAPIIATQGADTISCKNARSSIMSGLPCINHRTHQPTRYKKVDSSMIPIYHAIHFIMGVVIVFVIDLIHFLNAVSIIAVFPFVLFKGMFKCVFQFVYSLFSSVQCCVKSSD